MIHFDLEGLIGSSVCELRNGRKSLLILHIYTAGLGLFDPHPNLTPDGRTDPRVGLLRLKIVHERNRRLLVSLQNWVKLVLPR